MPTDGHCRPYLQARARGSGPSRERDGHLSGDRRQGPLRGRERVPEVAHDDRTPRALEAIKRGFRPRSPVGPDPNL